MLICVKAIRCLPFLLLAVAGASVQAMQPLTDGELHEVTGRDGIALDFSVKLNVNDQLDPIGCSLGNDDVCRLGLQLANRGGDPGAFNGDWITFKGINGSLFLDTLLIDGSNITSGPIDYFDAARFVFNSGSGCLLSGDAANPCELSDLQDLPALQLSFVDSALGDLTSDIELYLEIAGVAVEFDDPVTETAGYFRNENGSFLGLRVSDLNQQAARIDMGGRMQVFGF